MLAEFGDLIQVGDFRAIFSDYKGSLVGWDIDGRSIVSVNDISKKSGQRGLYRSINANLAGGPTQNDSVIGMGEYTSPEDAEHNGSNRYQLILGDPDVFDMFYDLPLDWYLGSGMYVDVNGEFTGFNLGVSDVVGAGVTALAVREAIRRLGINGISEGLGGPAGAIALAVDVLSWMTFDTSYTVTTGIGPTPIIPVPTPPVYP